MERQSTEKPTLQKGRVGNKAVLR